MHQIKFQIEIHTDEGPKLSSFLELRVKDSASNPYYLISKYVGIHHPECCKIISHTMIDEQPNTLINHGMTSTTRLSLEEPC